MPTVIDAPKTDKKPTPPKPPEGLPIPARPPATGFAALRPILLGVGLFLALNVLLTAGVTLSRLNGNFNFKYGNFLPAKLALLDQRAATGSPPNVLFLGTSQTNHGFIPSVFEESLREGSLSHKREEGSSALTAGKAGLPNRRITSFNLGLPNNRYDIMQGVLQRQVARYGKPKVVLLELGPSLQELDGSFYYLPALYYRTLVERAPALASQWLQNPQMAPTVRNELLTSATSTLRQFRYTFSPMNMLGKVVDAIQGKVRPVLEAKLSPLAAKLPLAVTDVASTAGPSSEDEELPVAEGVQPVSVAPLSIPAKTLARWGEGGWYAKEASPNMATPQGVEKSIEAARQYYITSQTSIHFDKLRSLLTYCKQQDIPVVLVSWPNHPGMNAAFRESRLSRDYEQGVAEVLRDYPKVPLIDFNGLGGNGINTDAQSRLAETARLHQFADPRHLTPDGAESYSRLLAKRFAGLSGR